LCWTGSEYLAIWNTGAAGYAALLDERGNSTGRTWALDLDPRLSWIDDIVFNGTSFAIMYRTGSQQMLRVFDRRAVPISAGRTLGTNFSFSGAAIATNGSNFLVAWRDGRSSTITSQFFRSDGEPILPPQVLAQSGDFNVLTDLKLAWTGSEYVAFFRRSNAGLLNEVTSVPVTSGAPLIAQQRSELVLPTNVHHFAVTSNHTATMVLAASERTSNLAWSRSAHHGVPSHPWRASDRRPS
jgi:hypothetical protein